MNWWLLLIIGIALLIALILLSIWMERKEAKRRRFIIENPEAWLRQIRVKKRGKRARKPGKKVCPDCGSDNLDFIYSMNRFQCKKCRRLFS